MYLPPQPSSEVPATLTSKDRVEGLANGLVDSLSMVVSADWVSLM